MDNKNFGLSILDTNDIMDGPWDKIYKMDNILNFDVFLAIIKSLIMLTDNYFFNSVSNTMVSRDYVQRANEGAPTIYSGLINVLTFRLAIIFHRTNNPRLRVWDLYNGCVVSRNDSTTR